MFSKFVRRSHLYLALFLSPWLLMYALSTMAMNHRDFFIARHGPGPVPLHPERELVFAGNFASDAPLGDISRLILASLELDGAHGVNRRADGAIVINRNDLTTPRRITYTPADNRLVIERMEPRANAFLERFHRRRGYETGYALDTAWAVTVDLTIAAMILWAVSGLWMWWEMKATRRLGAMVGLAGALVFALYIIAI